MTQDAGMSVLHDIVQPTGYRHDAPVRFGKHGVMLRLRDSHAQQVLAMDLDVSPQSEIALIQNAHLNSNAVVGSGVAHAWLQPYLPGAGWNTYDQANKLIGSRQPIRVGGVRGPCVVSPVQGNRFGKATAYDGMTAGVQGSLGWRAGEACEAPGCQSERS